MGIHVALDPGSCHMGKLKYGKELIDIAAGAGADSIKFQLFSTEFEKGGNVRLRFDNFKDLYDYGQKKHIAITASVFDQESYEFLSAFQVPYVKFSYSQQAKTSRIKALLDLGRTVVVSSDDMKQIDLPVHERLVRLFCVPQYPVIYHVDFESLFPPFDGFSDHTRGYGQTLVACEYGAMWIEKHIKLPYADVTCPDARFALDAKTTESMIKKIRDMWP